MLLHMVIAIGLLGFSLALGMWGYGFFEHLAWRDAFLNAAMLLGGMGPIEPQLSESRKNICGPLCLVLRARGNRRDRAPVGAWRALSDASHRVERPRGRELTPCKGPLSLCHIGQPELAKFDCLAEVYSPATIAGAVMASA
jgi:hypothetical protein